MSNKYIKQIPDSKDAYDKLKAITDPAQTGELEHWSGPVVELLGEYGIKVERKVGIRIQTTLSFPTSTDNDAMAIGIRHVKPDGSYAEDLIVFEREVGITAYYRGSQEEVLPEYGGTHHAKIALTEFLPELQKDISEIKDGISRLVAERSGGKVPIVTDYDFASEMQEMREAHEARLKGIGSMFGNTSVPAEAARQLQPAYERKRKQLIAKKNASDKQYEYERQKIRDDYANKYKEKQSDLGRRNMLMSGFGPQELEDIEREKRQELSQLDNLYGKDGHEAD